METPLHLPLRVPLQKSAEDKLSAAIDNLPGYIRPRQDDEELAAQLGAIEVRSAKRCGGETSQYLNQVRRLTETTSLSGAELMVKGLRVLRVPQVSARIRLQIHTDPGDRVAFFLKELDTASTPLKNRSSSWPEYENPRPPCPRTVALAEKAFLGVNLDMLSGSKSATESEAREVLQVFGHYLKRSPRIELLGSPRLVVSPRDNRRLQQHLSRE